MRVIIDDEPIDAEWLETQGWEYRNGSDTPEAAESVAAFVLLFRYVHPLPFNELLTTPAAAFSQRG